MDLSKILSDLGMKNIQSRIYQTSNYYMCDKIAQNIEFSNFAKYVIFPIKQSNIDVLSINNFNQVQQSIISPIYFQNRNDMRWNIYLIFVLENSVKLDSNLKYQIENDDNYARKHVVYYNEINTVISYIDVIKNNSSGCILDKNFIADWDTQLSKVNLNGCLYNVISKDAVKKYVENNQPIRPVGRPTVNTTYSSITDEDRVIKSIAEIEIDDFRSFCFGKKVSFTPGLVNLFSGGNGSGKTSVCEALEYGLTGEIRRNGQTKELGSIKIKYLSSGGKIKNLKSNKDLKEKKLLDNAWYGTAVNVMAKKSTLNSNFSSFNHLDAKTTVEFMLSEGPNIQRIVKNIVVGDDILECEEKWKRFEKEFAELGGSLKKQIDNLNHEIEDLKSRISNLSQPEITIDENILLQAAQSLSSSYFQMSKPYKWDEIYTHLISVQHDVNGLLNRDRMYNNLGSVNDERMKLEKQLGHSINDSKIIVQALEEIKVVEGEIQTKKYSLNKLKKETEELEVFNKLYQHTKNHSEFEKYKSINEFLNVYISKQNALEVISSIIPRDVINDKTLINLYDSSANAKLEEAKGYKSELDSELSRVNTSIKLIETENKERSVLILQFLDIIQREKDYICPLCGVDHISSTELVHAVNKILGKFQVNADLVKLSNDLSKLSSEIQINSSEILHLNQISNATRAIDDICQKVENKNILKLKSNHAPNKLLEIFEFLDSSNAFIERTKELFDDTQEVLSIGKRLYNSESFFDYESAYSNRIQLLQKNIAELEDSIALSEIAVNTKKVNIYETQLSNTSEITKLNNSISEIDALLKNVERINARFDSISKNNFEDWISKYNETVALLREFSSIKDGDNNRQLLENLIGDKNKEVNKLKMQQQTISSALTAFASLPKTDNYISEFLDINARQIENVFSMIHRPKEFSDISINNGKITFIRQENSERVDTNQMSTGQSIALTIALIISLFNSAPDAPKLLMFDEPIANMDDLHMMNFLDLIRDLAISGTQVFITTANTEISGLIRRKFSFFGNQFKHYNFERYEADPVKIMQIEYSPQNEEGKIKFIS